MLLANWLDVPDAMAFLDAFADAAETTRGWKLESIKTDFGHQFVYVCYTGRKFAGKGLMASAFAPITSVHQYRDREGAGLAVVNGPAFASPIRTAHASAGRSPALDQKPRTGRKLVAGGASPRDARAPIPKPPRGERMRHHPYVRDMQRVNITLRADDWPAHICFDQSAARLLAPLLKSAHQSSAALTPSTC